MDRRNTGALQTGEDPGHGRQDITAIVHRGKTADPAVEDLNHLGAGLNLRQEVVDHQATEARHQRIPEGGLRVHQPLGRQELARRLALDQVAGEREGRSRKADDGDRRVELPAEEADRLHDERHGLGRRPQLQPIYILPGSDRLLDDRAHSIYELQIDAKAESDRQHDIGEEDRSINAKPPHWLHRDLRAQLRVLADLKEVVSFSDLPVLG